MSKVNYCRMLVKRFRQRKPFKLKTWCLIIFKASRQLTFHWQEVYNKKLSSNDSFPQFFTLRRHTLHCHWQEVTRGTRVSQSGPAKHVSTRALPQSHCLGIVVTPVTGAKSRHTGASVGVRDHTSRSRSQEPGSERIEERGAERPLWAWPPPLHASLPCSSVHFAPNNVAKVSSEPDRPVSGQGQGLQMSSGPGGQVTC